MGDMLLKPIAEAAMVAFRIAVRGTLFLAGAFWMWWVNRPKKNQRS